MMKNRWLRCLSALLSVSVVLSLSPRILVAESDASEYYSVIEGIEYDVAAIIASQWGNYANLEFIITNTGEETIHNWYLTFSLPYHIEGVWNATVFETDDNGAYTFKNTEWNQDIQPGSAISFGMTVSSLDGTQIACLPSLFLLNTKAIIVDPADFTVNYQEYSNWGTGFNGSLILTNNSLGSLEDWNLSFYSNREITEVAGADLTTFDGVYTIANNGSNQNLSPNASVNLTINGSGQNTNSALTINDVTLFSIGCAFGLSEDENDNGIVDYIDFIHAQNNDPGVSPTPTGTPAPTISTTPVVSVTPSITSTPTVTSDPTLTPTDAPDYDYLDSDSDGLLDSEELMYQTDPNNPDTDGDDVTDFYEVAMGYNPLVGESDGDGICDGDKDFDLDGISNASEIERGICPFLSDSDDDNLTDYEEIYVYESFPDNDDSDNDGLRDGDEVALGLDPMNSDSDNDSIPDNEERFLQSKEKSMRDDSNPVISKVEVNLDGTGYIETSLSITDMLGKDVFSSELYGLVGIPVSFEYDGEIDEATIVFYYDESELDGVDENDLCLVWYDEENGEYELLEDEQVLDTSENSISYTTTHFSTYMLVSKPLLLQRWRETLEQAVQMQRQYGYMQYITEDTQYLVAVQLEYYDSGEDRQTLNEIYHAISDHLDDENYGGLLLYSGICQAHGAWNKQGYDGTAEEYISRYALDYSDYPNFTQLFSSASDVQVACSASNIILYIITSESEISITDEDWEEISRNGAYEIRVISTSSEVQVNNSTEASVDTICYTDTYPEFLDSIQKSMMAKTILNSDEDDYSDYRELSGFVLPNATFLTTNPQKGDSDDDSILDSDELIRPVRLLDLKIARIPDFRNLFAQYVGKVDFCWTCMSNPTNPDSDGDDSDDVEDARPLIKNQEKIYIITSDVFTNYGKALKNEYSSYGYLVGVSTVYSKDGFLSVWDDIGLCDPNQRNKYDDKTYYHVTGVVLQMHGSKSDVEISKYCYLGNNDTNATIRISDLSSKKIDTLVLFCCNTGQDRSKVYLQNFAEGILSQENLLINRVYAPDTKFTANLFYDSQIQSSLCSYYGWTYDAIEDVDSTFFDGKKVLSEELKNAYVPCAEGFKLFKRNANNEIINQNCYSAPNDDVITTHMYCCTQNGIKEYLLIQEYNGYDPQDIANRHNPLLSWKAGEIPG